jgi:hypothetical protein
LFFRRLGSIETLIGVAGSQSAHKPLTQAHNLIPACVLVRYLPVTRPAASVGTGARAAMDVSAQDLSGADADAWGGDELDLGLDGASLSPSHYNIPAIL